MQIEPLRTILPNDRIGLVIIYNTVRLILRIMKVKTKTLFMFKSSTVIFFSD